MAGFHQDNIFHHSTISTPQETSTLLLNKSKCNPNHIRTQSADEFNKSQQPIVPTRNSMHLLNSNAAIMRTKTITRTSYRRGRRSMLLNQISIVVILLICYYSSHHLNWPSTIGGANAQLLDNGDSSPPQEYHQHNNNLKFSVDENRPIGTYVGRIRSADGQSPYLTLPLPQTPEIEWRQAFNINLTTGDITTLVVLDREQREQYHFMAIIQPFAEVKCMIEVRDVNDNAPKFQTLNSNETNIVIDMPEGQRGYRQKLPLAFDYDSPLYGIKEFRIISGNTPSGTFQLVEHEAPARSTLNQNGNLGGPSDDSGPSMLANDNPQLKRQLDQEATVLIPSQPVLQQAGAIPIQSTGVASMRSFLVDLEASHPLDRENQSSYQLVIEAIDGGQPPQFGRLMVTVNVLDINDNDPVFHPKSYECFLYENATKGALVHRVQAYDADLDANGEVSYYLKRPEQVANSTANNYNNEVSINRPTNTKPRGPPSPMGKPSGVSQRSGANTEFQEVGGHKLRSSSPSSQSQDQLFDIDPNKGEIYLVGQLDYETDQMHDLVVEARDHGKPSRSAFTTVRVHVLDNKDEPSPPKSLDVGRQSGMLSSPGSSTTNVNGQAELRVDSPNESVSHPFNTWISSNVTSWFSQMNSSILFVIVFVALIAVTFPVCLIKIKSRQPESDYNDTAGLTMASNNGQTKPSPSHSVNNIEHQNGMLNDSLHHHHHDHQSRRPPNLGGSFGGQNMNKLSGYQYQDSSSNHYHNLYPAQQRPRHHSSTSHHLLPDSPADHHQISPVAGLQGIGGSRGGTMTMSHNHHHHHLHLPNQVGHHHSLDHHQHQFVGGNSTNSLAYTHSHAAPFMHQAHHHQSSHQLSPMHLNHQVQLGGSSHLNKGGTMNSIGTHHSVHHHPASSSPMPATPNTIHSSVIQPGNMHDQPVHHALRNATLLPSIPHSGQLPPTPTHQMNSCGNVFSYPPSHGPGSTLGCCQDGPHMESVAHDTPHGSTVDSCGSPTGVGGATQQHLDRWLNLNVPAQMVDTQDWCGSYNWDYLENWKPECHTILPLIQAESAAASDQ